MPSPLPILDEPAPQVPLAHLDELWFQVGGTVCNLQCLHCFISCSPHNHSFSFLSLETVRRYLAESVQLGVKEYYFTGGEPFLNRDMVAILEATLQYGPATVLTNGTIFKDDWLRRLRAAEDASPYSLEFRVSMDGCTAEANDAIRGPGTFERILRGVRQLLTHDFLPILTVTNTTPVTPAPLHPGERDEGDADERLFQGFVALLQSNGYHRPRIKLLPTLRIGAEEKRARGYHTDERVPPDALAGFDLNQLLCHHGRIVSDRGVHVCPILIESPDAILGKSLGEAQKPFALRHHACFTCYQHGALCANIPSRAAASP